MNTKTFQIALGLNDKDTKLQKYSTLEAYKIVTNLICARFGGGSVFEGRGVYRHTDGSNKLLAKRPFLFSSLALNVPQLWPFVLNYAKCLTMKA